MTAVLAAMTCTAGVPCDNITPRPAMVTPTEGQHRIAAPHHFQIALTGLDSAIVAETLSGIGFVDNTSSSEAMSISVRLDPKLTPAESYNLAITPQSIDITAADGAGAYYAVVTLAQLADGSDTIDCVEISDRPRYSYRGVMIDVSRHFFPKEVLKKQIDALAGFKINRLHLHLTDAAGWRIEIDGHPELTQRAAWRKGDTWKQWVAGGAQYATEGDSSAYGGYFTRDDIRELLEYARRHHMVIVPEIEMPSHSEEVTAVYPDLSCTHDSAGASDFCVGNEATFALLFDVLDQVCEMFPSDLIHVGGDEASKRYWRDCALCLERMQAEGLENTDQLQDYMMRRIANHLASHGRRMVGWDEIAHDSEMPDDAVVMVWRGEEHAQRAIDNGYQVILSPAGWCYLDSYQDAPPTQPEAISGYLPIEHVYSIDPQYPDSMVMGIQGNLWAEYIPTPEHLEYMLYPRIIALAEAGWSPQDTRDYVDFRRRVTALSDSMRNDGYNTFNLHTEVGHRPESQSTVNHLATGKKVTYNAPAWSNYPANGELTLTDGRCGDWNYSDRRWQAFVGPGYMDVTIDLESICDISSIQSTFMQICGPGVYLPANVTYSISDNGTDWATVYNRDYDVQPTIGLSFETFGWEGNSHARYVKVQARCAADYNGVLFTDEIIIR